MGRNRLGRKWAGTLHQSEHCHSGIVFPSECSKSDHLPHRYPSISSQPSLLHRLPWLTSYTFWRGLSEWSPQMAADKAVCLSGMQNLYCTMLSLSAACAGL